MRLFVPILIALVGSTISLINDTNRATTHFSTTIITLPILIVLLYTMKNHPYAHGSGVHFVGDAWRTKRALFLHPYEALLRIIVTFFQSFTLASLGSGGPLVHMSAAFSYKFTHSHAIMLASIGSTFACAFHTPITGIFYALEEIAHFRVNKKEFLTLLCMVPISYAVCGLFFHQAPLFPSALGTLNPQLGLSAIFCTTAGILWTKILNTKGLRKYVFEHKEILFCLLISIHLLTHGATAGSGGNLMLPTLHGESLGTLVTLGKILATLLSTLLFPGGLLVSTLTIGALLGGSHAALVGMMSFYAAINRAPLTAAIMTCELTGIVSISHFL